MRPTIVHRLEDRNQRQQEKETCDFFGIRVELTDLPQKKEYHKCLSDSNGHQE